MPGETPVRVDQEAHELLKEHADRSGRTLRDLASEAIKTHTGRDLREEFSGEVERLQTLCDRLEAQVDALERVEELAERFDQLETAFTELGNGFDANNTAYVKNNDRHQALNQAVEDAFRRVIEKLEEV